MHAGLNEIRPYMVTDNTVLPVGQHRYCGDLHDIGKNLLKLLMEAEVLKFLFRCRCFARRFIAVAYINP